MHEYCVAVGSGDGGDSGLECCHRGGYAGGGCDRCGYGNGYGDGDGSGGRGYPYNLLFL